MAISVGPAALVGTCIHCIGICIWGATCIAARATGVLLMRSFIPLSEEISIESTEDSSSMSTSFLT